MNALKIATTCLNCGTECGVQWHEDPYHENVPLSAISWPSAHYCDDCYARAVEEEWLDVCNVCGGLGHMEQEINVQIGPWSIPEGTGKFVPCVECQPNYYDGDY